MATKKTGRPTLAPSEAANVHNLLRRVWKEQFGGNQSAFARALGMEQPSLRGLLNHSNPSRKTLQKLATLVGAKHYEDILSGEAARAPAADPKFPSKTQAAEAAQLVRLATGAIDRMLADAPRELEHDPGPLYWLKRVEAYDMELGARDGGPRRGGKD